MARRKNVKRIDPRYFLEETVLWEGDEEALHEEEGDNDCEEVFNQARRRGESMGNAMKAAARCRNLEQSAKHQKAEPVPHWQAMQDPANWQEGLDRRLKASTLEEVIDGVFATLKEDKEKHIQGISAKIDRLREC
jgi:hypothetical protein